MWHPFVFTGGKVSEKDGEIARNIEKNAGHVTEELFSGVSCTKFMYGLKGFPYILFSTTSQSMICHKSFTWSARRFW